MGIGLISGGKGIYKKDNYNIETKLYRYMKLAGFIKSLESNKLYCKNMKKWLDSWENPTNLLEVNDKELHGLIDTINIINNKLCGICFSKDARSEAMWSSRRGEYEEDFRNYAIVFETKAELLNNSINIDQYEKMIYGNVE